MVQQDSNKEIRFVIYKDEKPLFMVDSYEDARRHANHIKAAGYPDFPTTSELIIRRIVLTPKRQA